MFCTETRSGAPRFVGLRDSIASSRANFARNGVTVSNGYGRYRGAYCCSFSIQRTQRTAPVHRFSIVRSCRSGPKHYPNYTGNRVLNRLPFSCVSRLPPVSLNRYSTGTGTVQYRSCVSRVCPGSPRGLFTGTGTDRYCTVPGTVPVRRFDIRGASRSTHKS